MKVNPILENTSRQVEKQRQKIMDFTIDLIRFKTENPASNNAPRINRVLKGEADCHQYLSEKLKALRFTIDQWRLDKGFLNLVASYQRSESSRTLLFNGHIDTVPAGNLESWRFDPWMGKISEGRIHGLGSVDMKGGIAAFVSAIEIVLNQENGLQDNVIVEIVSDEEMAGRGTRECLKRGYTSDISLFAEPTNLSIIICEPGLIHLRIEVFGQSAHSSTRYKSIHAGGKGYGVNAIEKAVKIIHAIGDLEREWANKKIHPLLPPGLNYIHPGIILGGPGGGKDGKFIKPPENPGTFPDYCSIEYELKFYPDESLEKVKKEFEQYLFHVCKLDSWLKDHPPKVTWAIRDIYFPPAQISVHHPLIQTISKIHRSFGRVPEITGYAAVTDMCWYSSRGIPSIVYGPGEIHLAHSTNESISIEDLLYATKVYAGTLLQMG